MDARARALTTRKSASVVRVFPEEEQLFLPGLSRTARIRPFIKWAGGKTRLMPILLPHVPAAFGNYYEPFLGGGAMFFAVRHRATDRCFLSDLNDELINAFQVVQRKDPAFLGILGAFRAQDSKEFFYSMRSHTPSSDAEQAARFVYLNQTAWNGLWRVNRQGDFNVPWGDRSFRGMSPQEYEAAHQALSGATIELLDFRAALERPRRGDFVYLDPPYLPVSDTSKFFFYTEKRFRQPDLQELALASQHLSERGVSWLLSNRDTSAVRELFSHANVIRLTTRRSVAAQNRRDIEPEQSPEVIIVGKPS